MMSIRLANDKDAAVLAHIDAAARDKAWTSAQFASILAQNHYRIEIIDLSEQSIAFAVWQICGDEAELHLLATLPERRRCGAARALLQHFLTDATLPRPLRVFLEVAESNAAARALYRHEGFVETGRRKGYYTHVNRPPEDAILMEQTC